jgi:hypothetical protein
VVALGWVGLARLVAINDEMLDAMVAAYDDSPGQAAGAAS